MTATAKFYQDRQRPRLSAHLLKMASSLIAVTCIAIVLTSCTKRTFTANIPFDPAKTVADHGFSIQSSSKTAEKRDADGSVENEWRGTIASAKPNDWEALPGFWRDDIEQILGFKPNETFPSAETRKPGEPFGGSLSWTENGISEEMQISLKPDDATKQVEYRISVKGDWEKK